MNKYLTVKHLFLLTGFTLVCAGLYCQPELGTIPKTKRAIFDLFRQGEISELTITSNFDSIKSNIRNKSYVSGYFEVKHDRHNSTKLDVKLRPRGKSRRMMCDFPPLKLKFDKKNLDSLGLEKFNDFKLVTHCLKDKLIGETNIKREYLVYQLFNLLTPYSFKASLVKITYKNTGSSFKKITNLGIIIEDSESLAHRNKCGAIELKIISMDSLHRNQEKIASVFQYMIGNADWSYLMARNTEFILHEEGQVVPVPYDFDYAGLVRAPYARADASLGQKTVLDRVFLGNSKTYEDLSGVFKFFNSKKSELFQTIDDFVELEQTDRTDMKNYLESFFELIENKERVENEMLVRVKKG